jgi:acetyl-CoA carboxylase carboxyltransferase component
VAIIKSSLDVDSQVFSENRAALLEKLKEVDEQLQLALLGGGEKYIERHHTRGKLLARERIEMLLDPNSPFLELCPLAAWGTQYNVGASLVAGIGFVSGVMCLISANDPTVKGGSTNPFTMRKSSRLADIALENNLPTISLVESGGADLPTQSEIFIPGGRGFRDLTQRSAKKIPTVAVVFGNSTAGGAYIPAMCDYIVMIKNRSKVFLGGPPLVKMATGEESTDEELGGAEMHARVSGLADYLAEDEPEAIAMARSVLKRIKPSRQTPKLKNFHEPRYDPEELLGIASSDLRVPFDPREIIARIADDSDFDEFKAQYGTSLVTGWGEISGFPIGILANHRGVLFSEEANKATQFIQLANQIDTPLLFLQNTTGYIVGKAFEQRGIIKDGAKMINAVSNSSVPHITINIGASYGAGNYGMCGRAYNPRFLFAWPNAKSAVMGPQQLAGVLSIVARQSAKDRGIDFDEEANEAMRKAVEAQIEKESDSLFLSGLVYDDGIIDPRDTRIVLSLCLSAIYSGEIKGAKGYGVFRM